MPKRATRTHPRSTPPRPKPKPSYPTLDSWAHARVVPVDLEEGLRADMEIPDLSAYLALGTIPNPLRGIAERMESGVVEPARLDEADRKSYFELQVWIVASHLRKPNLVKELGGKEAAAEWVREKMPPLHRQKLWNVALYHSGFAVPIDDAEALEWMKGLVDMAPFRGGGTGAPVPAGSGANGDSPE